MLDVMKRLYSNLEERSRLEEETASLQLQFETILRTWEGQPVSVVINKSCEQSGLNKFEIRLEDSNFSMYILARTKNIVVVLEGPKNFHQEFSFEKTTQISIEEMKKTANRAMKVVLAKDLNDDLEQKTKKYMSRFRTLWNNTVSNLIIGNARKSIDQQLYFEVSGYVIVVEAIRNKLIFEIKDDTMSDEHIKYFELFRTSPISDAQIKLVIEKMADFFRETNQ